MERIQEKCKGEATITVTIDYSCLDKAGEREDMAKLKIFSQEGLIDMRGTEYMDREFYVRSPRTVRVKLRQQFEFFQKLYPDDPAVLGKGRLGRFGLGEGGTVRDGKDVFEYFNVFKQLMFPDFNSMSDDNKKGTTYDILHLSIHYIFERDIFLTRDMRLKTRTESLSQEFRDLIVMTPQELVSFLERNT